MKIKQTTVMATVLALAAVATFISFPVLPSAPYLKVDFSDSFLIIVGALYGWSALLISVLIKTIFVYIKHPEWVGLLANTMGTLCYTLAFYGLYKRSQKKWNLVFASLAGTLVLTAVMSIANLYFLLPAYGIKAGLDVVVVTSVIPFNLIKGLLVSIVTLVLLAHRKVFSIDRS